MSGKVVRVLIALLIVALVSYVIILNLQQVEVKFSPSGGVETRMGLVLILTFCAGLVSALLFALLIGIGAKLRARKLTKEQQRLKSHYALIAKAREQLALGDYQGARAAFRKVIDEDPNDVTARVLCAETFSRQGQYSEALAVLDGARVEQKTNVELLLLAADLNSALGNHTAAYDNAALVLKHAPKNKFALMRLVEDCASLDRIAEAIDYQKQLLKVSDHADQAKLQERLAELELELVVRDYLQNEPPKGAAGVALQETQRSAFKQSVTDILRKHRGFPPALNELAAIEVLDGNLDAATRHWQDAYSSTGDPHYLELAANAWLEVENPTKAVAVVRNAVNKRSAAMQSTAEGRLVLVRLLLNLESIDEARSELNAIDQRELDSADLRNAHDIVRVRYLARVGKIEKALSELLEISERLSGRIRGEETRDLLAPKKARAAASPLALTWQGGQSSAPATADGPPPVLSTP